MTPAIRCMRVLRGSASIIYAFTILDSRAYRHRAIFSHSFFRLAIFRLRGSLWPPPSYVCTSSGARLVLSMPLPYWIVELFGSEQFFLTRALGLLSSG
ncbi:hypothetical protein GIB67_040272 [Kingdonia uniflora]|uniref:Uncharacterized protein n=1 Tax=Kingdonia uniflora TaxID=39325 RepID=A0A7J7MVN9_9MAGN|nr:hypothetical protein GIB67_040272 [Kingdonia uniflora]